MAEAVVTAEATEVVAEAVAMAVAGVETPAAAAGNYQYAR